MKNNTQISNTPKLFQSISWEGENALGSKIRQAIWVCLKSVVGTRVEVKIADVKIEHPSIENYGDYSTNIAMVLAGRLGLKPRDLAEKIAEELNKYIKDYQTRTPLTDSLSHQDEKKTHTITEEEPKVPGQVLESASVAGPGFVNLTIRSDYLITLLTEVLETQQSVITTKIKGKKIAVEYTDPNPFKEFHLGHMYSNFIGESISRLFEACGTIVWRGDFYGDVGMHVCKSVWGMMKKMEEEKISLEQLEKLSLTERQQFLGKGYSLGVREYEENEANAEKIRDINYLIYVSAQDILQKKKGWKPIIDYRKYIHGKDNDFEEVYKVYEAGLRWSLEYFESIYKRLGTKFDGYYPESWVGEYGMELVEKGLRKGVLEKDGGAVIYRGGKEGLHTRVFVNKLGLPTYETKDLGLAFAKYQDFKYDLSINIFGKEIDEYYYVVKSALRQIDPELGMKAFHLAHGMVKLPEGKMSSRTGNVITFEGLMDKLKTEILSIMKDSELSKDEKEKVAEAVGLAAVRYALLKSDIGVDVVFDLKKSVSFEGDSGSYLMYTYARCKSVLRKAQAGRSKLKTQSSKTGTIDIIAGDAREGSQTEMYRSLGYLSGRTRKLKYNTEELSLLRTLYRFPEVVTEAARSLSPHLLCGFLFDLAQKFNLFYNKHSILNPDNIQQIADGNNQPTTQFRLALTEATSIILARGLYLLGIETVERM